MKDLNDLRSPLRHGTLNFNSLVPQEPKKGYEWVAVTMGYKAGFDERDWTQFDIHAQLIQQRRSSKSPPASLADAVQVIKALAARIYSDGNVRPDYRKALAAEIHRIATKLGDQKPTAEKNPVEHGARGVIASSKRKSPHRRT